MKYTKFLFYSVFLFLTLSIYSSNYFLNKRNQINFKSNIYVFTSLDFIDAKFNDVIPFIEPASIDGFSYMPKYIRQLVNPTLDLYGYNLLEQNKKISQDCQIDSFRTGSINKCIIKDYWKNLKNKDWNYLSSKYNVQFVFSDFHIESLYLCKKYLYRNNGPIGSNTIFFL